MNSSCTLAYTKANTSIELPVIPRCTQNLKNLSPTHTVSRSNQMESGGSNISNNNENKQWRAEEAIAGNAEALQALRELITFPLYYSSQAKKLGLKVSTYIHYYY